MLIAYCEKCGMRVPEAPEDTQSGPVFCKTCAPAVVATGAKSTGSARLKSPARGSGILPTIRKNEAAQAAAAPKARGGMGQPKTEMSTGMLMGIGGIVIGLGLGLFVAFGGSAPTAAKNANAAQNNSNKNDTSKPQKNEPPKNETKSPSPSVTKNEPPKAEPPVVKPPDGGASKNNVRNEDERKPRTPAPAVEVADMREEFAARKWTELQHADKTGKMPAREKHKRIAAFAQSYANTKPGREAAEWLEKNPPEAPPPPPPPVQPGAANTLILSNLDTDSEIAKWTKDGVKDTTTAYGGKGASVRATPIGEPQSYFGARLVFTFDEPIAVKDTWVRFAYKAEGAERFGFHSSFDDGLYEAYVGGIENGKWKWCTVKLSDYSKAIRGQGLPAAGMKMKAVTLLAVRKGEKTTVYVDNLTVGEGPIPEPPKEE